MSRSFMPWYIGDYLRDTGHLNTEQHGAYLLLLAHCFMHDRIPETGDERAAIVRLPVGRWNKIKAPIERFFAEDGTQKRVAMEIARTERKILQAQAAGRKGGLHSGIRRAVSQGEAAAEAIAEMKRTLKRNRSDRLLLVEAAQQARTERTRTNQKEDITTTFSVAAKDEQNQPAGSLASALPTGALARPPTTEEAEGKQAAEAPKPTEATRQDLEASFARRRAREVDLTIPEFLRRTSTETQQ